MERISVDQLGKFIRTHDIKPDDDFTAAAGADYGLAQKWIISEDLYLIEISNSGSSEYILTDDDKEMPDWLLDIDRGLDALEEIEYQANIMGSDYIEEASESDRGEFFVLVTKFYYNLIEYNTILRDDRYTPIAFSSYKEAADWITEAESETYVLAHNECSRPHYKIISM